MISRRQTLGLFGAAAATAVLPAIRPARAAATEFRIGWQKNGVLALAKRRGAIEKRLADKGITVSWSEFTSGPPLLEALGAGALDFGATGDVPPLFAQAAGGQLYYVGTYRGSAAGSAIVVRKDSDIKTVEDLKGKKVAFKRGSSAHNVTVKILRKAGLKIDDVELVDLGSLSRHCRGRSADAYPVHRRGDRAVLQLLPRQCRLHRCQWAGHQRCHR
jgi:sulfonate transport system substrate-binding protein